MPTADERAVELRRFFPDRVVAAILGVEQEEIAQLAVDPSDEVEGEGLGGGGEADPQAGQLIHFTGDWQQGASYGPSSFGYKAALGSDLKLYLALGNTDPDVNPADSAGIDDGWLPFSPAGGGAGAFASFDGEWLAGDYPAGTVVTYGQTTFLATADATADDEPGISGAPLTDNDQIQTVWAVAGEMRFDTTEGQQGDGDPFSDDVATYLYVPVTHAGHLQIGLDTFDDHYVSYLLVKGSDMSLQGSGASDTSLGFDLDSTGDWFIQLYHDPGFDSGHDAGPVVANLVLSAGLTLQAAPEANPWQAFAAAP